MTPGSSGPNNSSPSTPALPDGVRWVDTPDSLADLVSYVESVHQRDNSGFRSCLDTEADSLHHYQEKLCLLQLAVGDQFALVDPLAVPDIMPLLRVLDHGEVWFHGADYDLTLLRRTYGWTPRVLRDTQIASRLAGHRQFGLASLIEKHFDKAISKASQKADWSRRPLSTTMLSYAVDDVRYLLELGDTFIRQLQKHGRMKWFEQSCEDLRQGVATRKTEPKEDPWRIQGSGRLQPRGLAFVKDLWHWREKIAEERDVPCFRVISNRQIIDLATALEQNRRPQPPAGWRPRWKRDFDECVDRILTADESTYPQRIKVSGGRLGEKAREQLDLLCQHREQVAAQLDLEPSLLGARGALERVVAAPEGIQCLLPWQTEVLGDALRGARNALGFTDSADG